MAGERPMARGLRPIGDGRVDRTIAPAARRGLCRTCRIRSPAVCTIDDFHATGCHRSAAHCERQRDYRGFARIA